MRIGYLESDDTKLPEDGISSEIDISDLVVFLDFSNDWKRLIELTDAELLVMIRDDRAVFFHPGAFFHHLYKLPLRPPASAHWVSLREILQYVKPGFLRTYSAFIGPTPSQE